MTRHGPEGEPSAPDANVARKPPAPDDTGTQDGTAEIVPVLKEVLAVSKRRVVKGTVRVSTRTVASDAVAEISLDRSVVNVTRVPIGRVVDVAPELRVEGDTTILPVFEERLVVVKQLVLVEEIHIRRRIEQDTVRQPVSLRQQKVVVERFDADRHPRGEDMP